MVNIGVTSEYIIQIFFRERNINSKFPETPDLVWFEIITKHSLLSESALC